MNRKSFLFLFAISSQLFSCTSLLPDAYKHDLPQGNKINAKQMALLKLGQTKQQVQYILGSSILTSNPELDHWQYLFYQIKAGEQPKDIQQVDLFFKNNKLTRINKKGFKNVSSASNP